MEIRFLEESEYRIWDKFVDTSPQGFIFSKSYWLDTMTDKNYKICILENENEIYAGIVLPNFKRKKIKNILLTQSTGILFRDMSSMKEQKILTNEKEYTNLLINYLKNNNLIIDFDLCFNPNYKYWLPLYWNGFKQTTRYTYYLNYKKINLSEEFKKFSKGHKWTLNKVEKNENIKVEETDNLEEVYEVLRKTYEKEKKEIIYSLQLLKKIDNILRKREEIKIFKIYDKSSNKIHAVGVFIYNEKEVYYWLGGSDEKCRKEGTHTYLIWKAINYFANKTQKFNFGGSMIEEIEKNFRNFGGELTPYFNIYWSKNWSIFYLKKLIKSLRGE